MAFTPRTINQIFTELLSEKENLTTLDSLIPDDIIDEATMINKLANSDVAEWILWLYNTAVNIHYTELRTLSAVEDIDTILTTKRYGSEKWYIEQALAFQKDYIYIIDPITRLGKYDTIDETAKVVGSCTIQTYANKLIFKLRHRDLDIFPVEEINQFIAYIEAIKIAGTKFSVQSYDGDLLTLNFTIYYNGQYAQSAARTTIENTINDYLNNLEFDSSFLTSSLIDKLQQLPEVIDPRFDGGIAIDTLGNPVEFVHEYITNAGWAQINPSTPLSATITMVAKNKF